MTLQYARVKVSDSAISEVNPWAKVHRRHNVVTFLFVYQLSQNMLHTWFHPTLPQWVLPYRNALCECLHLFVIVMLVTMKRCYEVITVPSHSTKCNEVTLQYARVKVSDSAISEVKPLAKVHRRHNVVTFLFVYQLSQNVLHICFHSTLPQRALPYRNAFV